MDLEKLTDRARGFLQAAQTIAVREHHQRIAPAHLLKALLDDEQGMAAVAYAERNDWMPEVDERGIYPFDEIPQLAEDYRAGKTGIFPCFAVNPD